MGNCNYNCVQVSKTDNEESAKLEQLKSATYESTDEITYNFKLAKVIKVYDGDTITIAAHFAGQLMRFSVRVFGVDCDEMKGGTKETKRNARLAKKFVEKMILGKIVNIDVLNNKLYEGKIIHEKFGRLLAKISIDGKDLSEELLKVNLARPYYGGHKTDDTLHPTVDLSLDELPSNVDSDDERKSSPAANVTKIIYDDKTVIYDKTFIPEEHIIRRAKPKK